MIDNDLLMNASGLKLRQKINAKNLGYVDDDLPDIVTFIDDERFIDAVNRSKNIHALFITRAISKKISNKALTQIVVDDPRYYFFELFNYVNQKNYKEFKTRIDPTARVNLTAFIAENNVTIGKNVIVDPNVTIYPDVEIGDNSIIRASAVLGQHGYEYKKTKRGILSVFHTGKVVIGQNVEIRANTCIDKGLFPHRNTVVGDNTKINALVMIEHGVQIGKSCFILTCASISGSSTIGDNVWVSPNAAIINGTVVGDNAVIGMGAVVIRNVEAGAVMVGNPAKMIRKNQ
jgi:UDP-3-O-[3-hydroxymyristoyl] glucosamine N-acyltransferase